VAVDPAGVRDAQGADHQGAQARGEAVHVSDGWGVVIACWLGVIALSVADSAWEAVLTFIVAVAAASAALILLRRLWP
jgi:hypothetical protein